MNCPKCGKGNSYQGFISVECPTKGCENFSQRQHDEVSGRKTDPGIGPAVWPSPMTKVCNGSLNPHPFKAGFYCTRCAHEYGQFTVPSLPICNQPVIGLRAWLPDPCPCGNRAEYFEKYCSRCLLGEMPVIAYGR